MISRTVLEIDFDALSNNVNLYKSYLKQNTKLCAVIKAAGYGSSDVGLAELYEKRGIDYLLKVQENMIKILTLLDINHEIIDTSKSIDEISKQIRGLI